MEKQELAVLVFDVETTGLIEHQEGMMHVPRVVEISWILLVEGEVTVRRSCIVKPSDFEIPLAAARLHGITTERAMSEGADGQDVFGSFAEVAASSQRVVAHNLAFDETCVVNECRLHGLANPFDAVDRVCTMKTSAVRYRDHAPGRSTRYLKLSELHLRLFGKPPPGSHRAEVDVQTCCSCYVEMCKRGMEFKS